MLAKHWWCGQQMGIPAMTLMFSALGKLAQQSLLNAPSQTEHVSAVA
ncbi:hypothetical protein [Erwinia sp. V71]